MPNSHSDQARINGSLSLGPTSPEGKAKSQLNRLSHGFRASSVSLANEHNPAYTAHLNAYLARYAPIDKTEEDLVGLCAVNMWQYMRITAIEAALFDLELFEMTDNLTQDFSKIDEAARLALAFKKSAGDNWPELLRRYKVTADRAYHRAFDTLEKIRKERLANPPNAPAPEPSPAPPTTEISIRTQDDPENPPAPPELFLVPATPTKATPSRKEIPHADDENENDPIPLT